MIYTCAEVISCEKLSEEIYSLWLRTEAAEAALPGQFVMLAPKGEAHLLMRPLSICEAVPETKQLRLVFRTAGYGTGEFSGAKPGDGFLMLGPLGHGFPEGAAEGKERILLLGGGIGIPPLLFLAKKLGTPGIREERVTAVLGYRSAAGGLFLSEEFREYARTVFSSEDGSAGTKGTVLDAVREQGIHPDLICACGPMPMLRAVKRYAGEQGIPAYLSLEERMACGAGACLGCVVKTVKEDAHSHVKNARVCTEGPVFRAEDVSI